MKSTQAFNSVGFLACLVLVVGLSVSASASCSDSLSAMVAGAASVQAQSSLVQQASESSKDNNEHPSIIGLWYVRFNLGDQTIQEAYQIWNAGGTEVHNPNVDPRSGTVCLGAWKHTGRRTYKLAHRVWSYDINGNFMGTIHLSETLTLGKHGNTHRGSFTLDIYDPSGVFQTEVAGSVTGERISVE